MKKAQVIMLVVLMIFSVCLPVSAADESKSFLYELSVDGNNTKNVQQGDIITVTLVLKRTDSDESYEMYGIQDEIRYDPSFFELVEDSAIVSDGINTENLTLRDGQKRLYMNFVSMNGGEIWKANTTIGSFRLKVIAESGSSEITNENVLVSVKDGSDTYVCQKQNVEVIISDFCTVRFDSCGGTAVDSVTVHAGEKLTKPTAPTKDGFAFDGWYKDIDHKAEWNFESETVEHNMTLFAKWKNEEIPIKNSPVDEPPITKKSSNPIFIYLTAAIIILMIALIIVIAVLISSHKKKTK